MPKTNIDKFDEITGRLFADLYNSFPEPMQIATIDYITPLINTEDLVMEVVQNDAERRFVYNTITWLIEAGFISISTCGTDAFYNAVLTAKGLECLKKTPDSLTPSTGKQLSEAAKNGSVEILKGLTNQALSIGVTIASQKIGLY